MSDDRNARRIEALRQVAAVALSVSSWLVPELLPTGKLRQGRYWALNPNRGDRSLGSFYVTMATGGWHDWASGDRGGDLVSLAAYVWHVKQLEAAKQLASRLGLSVFDGPATIISEESRQKQAARVRKAMLEAEAKRVQAEQDRVRGAVSAKRYAHKLWSTSPPASGSHPYLVRKGITPVGARQKGDMLLLPVYRKGELINLQRIFADGSKVFLRHGEVMGGYIPIGKPVSGDTTYICEGWATGKSVAAMHGNAPVICALNTENLLVVTDFLVERFGDEMDFVIARDDDRKTAIMVEGEKVDNPGKVFAEKAASKHKLRVIAPNWPSEAPLELSDFNDLDIWRKANSRVN